MVTHYFPADAGTPHKRIGDLALYWAKQWFNHRRPFVSKKSAEEFIATFKTGKAALDSVNSATYH
jgi:hypothetical protein